ncbi:MAG: hypothetical protein JSR82_14710 [Verrucomicrobia bacterium]|nr:hypothetical protein [Verrucomicrobiota bacterium]
MSFRRFRRRLRDSLQKVARFDVTSLSLNPFRGLRRWQRKRREAASSAATRAAAPQEGAPIVPLPAQRSKGFGATLRQSLPGRILAWPFVHWRRLLQLCHNRLVKAGLRNATARFLVLSVATILVLAALGTGAWFTKGLVAEQRIRNLMATGRAEEAAGNAENAVNAYTLVLKSRPNHIEANERMADMSLRARVGPAAIRYRKRLVEIEPENLKRKLRWAEVSLAFNQRATAEEALNAVPEAQRKDVDYLRLRATLDAASGRSAEVEASLRALLALKPDDAPAAMRLAALQLMRSRDPAEQTKLRADLERFLAVKEVSLETARLLTGSYQQAGDSNAALRTARLAAEHPDSRVSDGLALVNILQTTAPALVDPALARLKEKASATPQDAFEVTRWILARGRYNESDEWLMSLKPEVREAPVLLVARADTAMAQKQWDRLEALTSGSENWGEMEVQRIAFSARAARERGQPAVGRTRWAAAIRQAGDSIPLLRQLRQIGYAWSWPDERADVEWQLLRVDVPSSGELLGRLYEYYRDRLDTPGLRRVFEKIVELNPDDLRATRNLALLYLIGRVQVPKAHELALRAHVRNPAELDGLVCYGYALHVKGDTDEALALLDPEAKAIRNHAYLGGYYGLILAAKGRGAEAKPLLQEALSSKLLPEEAAALKAELEKL